MYGPNQVKETDTGVSIQPYDSITHGKPEKKITP